ncbi:PilW family protein [Neisseria weaveri]|uniref:PilW family protein n=1 Tax=Neisseria weaveri TaxID=28091 RepID=UPI00022326B9|nr:hypothetical protein [Neisseria weaveri]EGV34811.1 hypothetical protein l13_20720 [Neisseria weaveri ATCC 51223]
MMNKNDKKTIAVSYRNKCTVSGFSLMEFLIASALSVIVLIAVGTGYLSSRKLNDAANSRLAVQQDLRHASNMIVRDAHMAGLFGCFNMSSRMRADIVDNQSSAQEAFRLAGSTDYLIPIKEIPVDQFSVSGFAPDSSALVFRYGLGTGSINNLTEDIPDNAPLVYGNCNKLVRPAADGTAGVNLKKVSADLGNPDQMHDISVMRYVVHAYATGTVGAQRGLYRFRLENGNRWGPPQLLMADVSSMSMEYVYVNNCPENHDVTETFEYTSVLKDRIPSGAGATVPSNQTASPAFISISLTNIKPGNSNFIYNIDASLKGGNVCAERTF